MGLRREIQAELARAFDTDLADAVAVVDGSRSVPGTYDPEKGGSMPATTLHYTGRGVFGQYKAREIDGTRILASDVRLKALQNELLVKDGDVVTDVPGIPTIGDRLSGYRVMNVGQDAAKATWTIQLRK
ncbi:hypothetical protein N5J66_05820 [Pseudomonas juntendi]|uniref:hypothetical protein n=1 Tax=Pseudomonas TaxID=286 RepID=UPI0007D88288|nr:MULTISPECIES: hypothetical protein [Pseudomonas]OAK58499.1 hypothetical protein A3K88_21865 [Pseudomonas putida]MBH3372875.1 hypothetical protein [Pseudomonas juntendi]MCK2109225.1 hypothetical protein [Pseudomonas juntendi]MCK2118934.1 hypothetical protein [Pseudomonas juntendi]MDH2013487.1 hypothetical protein [Pseudomonas juntendi]